MLCVDGSWRVTVPGQTEPSHTFEALDDVFKVEEREARGEHLPYERFILKTLRKLQQDGRKFGALILEPVVLGAGGMLLV